MADLSYAADLHTKIGLRPSRQAIKRAALALAWRSASPAPRTSATAI